MTTTRRGPGRQRKASGPVGSRPPRLAGDRQTGPRSKTRSGDRSSGSGAKPNEHDPAPAADTSVTTRAAVLAVVVGVLVLSFAFPLRAWVTQQSELSRLNSDNAALTESLDMLEHDLELWRDPAFIRTQARDRLNMIAPGEQVLVVIGDPPAEPVESDSQLVVPGVTGSMPWWSRLWAGAVEAGRTPGSAPSVPEESVGAPADQPSAGSDTGP